MERNTPGRHNVVQVDGRVRWCVNVVELAGDVQWLEWAPHQCRRAPISGFEKAPKFELWHVTAAEDQKSSGLRVPSGSAATLATGEGIKWRGVPGVFFR